MAVLSLYETTALLTPGTASRLIRTISGQSAHYIFFTANVMVFSAAKAVDEARTVTAIAAETRSLVTGILRSCVEEQGCKEIESKRGNDKDRCESE